MDNLEIAQKVSYELQLLNTQIKAKQRELTLLLREKETKEYFISLLEKELTDTELEIFTKLKRLKND
jgi:hypothetical protein